MPAIAPSSLTIDPSAVASSPPSANSTDHVLEVVCAWPVSGQYGPGSRVLYYVLIATCLVARRVGWLVNACLAIALLFPAVAALHGIVLAALHVDGAVDMDIFGAFQLCSIGILAAPVTVMLSRTFFNDPGRNIIFLWALLIFVGLVSLAVEFYRIQTEDCPFADAERTIPVSPHARDFPYEDQVTCGLRCSPETGPKSPMRGGAADNVYVIPAPSVLKFGSVTLLAAACSLHAILCLVSMWTKVLQRNWEKHFGSDEHGNPDEPISGTNGATKQTMRNINTTIGHYLSMVAIPVFGGAGVAITIVGEINFFSRQVWYQTEPMASIGQWAPIVGTGLGMLGSLYLLLAHDVEAVTRNNENSGTCTCAHRHKAYSQRPRGQSDPDVCRGSDECRSQTSGGSNGPRVSHESVAVDESYDRKEDNSGRGSRLKVAEFLNKMGHVIGSPPKSWAKDEFLRDDAYYFPTVPAEDLRHGGLQKNIETYVEMVDNSHSGATSTRGCSPPPPRASRSRSRQARASTMPTSRSPSEDAQHPSLCFDEDQGPKVGGKGVGSQYGQSLAVPTPVHHLGEAESQSSSRTAPAARTGRRRMTSPTQFSDESVHMRMTSDFASRDVDSVSLSSLPHSPAPSADRAKFPAIH